MKWPWSKPESLPTGRAITTPIAMPEHAEHLRAFNFARAQKTRMYDAAVTNQFNQDFPSTYGSADAEILNSLYISRNRARTLVKDYPIAKGIVRNDSNNVVGEDAFRLEMKVTKPGSKPGSEGELDSEINAMIELAWKEAGEPEHCTVRKTWSRMELYHMVESEVITAGGVLGRHFRGFKNDFGYAIDCLEIDRLDQNYMGKSVEGNNIRFSIELDAYSAPIRYWLLTRHPGDVFGYANKYPGMKASQWREPVDANDIIAFFNMRQRAEQTVGMTELDSIIQQLHRDRQFDIAHVYAAIWASCKPFFIVQEFPTGMQYAGDPAMQAQFPGLVGSGGTNELTAGAGDTKGGGVNKVKVQEPASGEILPWGQKPMLVDPKFPVESAVGFKKNNLEAVATGCGQAYAEVSADYSGLSFSAARMAVLPSRDNYKVRQKHMICGFVQSHFRNWLKQAMLSTYFEQRFGVTLSMSRYKEFCRAAHFHGKRWGYINPLQDIQADVIAKESLLKSPQEIRAESENGGSIEDVYRQTAEAKKMADALGITPPDPVTNPTLKKGDPSQDDGQGGATKTGGKNVMNKNRSEQEMSLGELMLQQIDDFGEPKNGHIGTAKTR